MRLSVAIPASIVPSAEKLQWAPAAIGWRFRGRPDAGSKTASSSPASITVPSGRKATQVAFDPSRRTRRADVTSQIFPLSPADASNRPSALQASSPYAPERTRPATRESGRISKRTVVSAAAAASLVPSGEMASAVNAVALLYVLRLRPTDGSQSIS